MSERDLPVPHWLWRTPAFRWGVFIAGLVAIVIVVALGAAFSLGHLEWPMLVLLLDAILVGLLSGPMYGVIIAVISAAGVQYFLIYPANTWKISSPSDLTSLIVFIAVSVGAVLLAWVVTRAKSAEARATARARLLATVVDTETTPDVPAALERVRVEYGLDTVVLLGATARGVRPVIATSGAAITPTSNRSIQVNLPQDHELVGYGPELFAEDRRFLEDLAAAVFRAYDSQRLAQEQERSRLLAAADSARAAVLAAVGHDLRTPLAGLRVALDGLSEGAEVLTSDESEELVDTALRSTRRLDELISNLIDLSRLQAGVLPVSIEPTDLGAVVAQAASDTERQLVSANVSESLPLVPTDPVLLERIVSNLISNAVRHSPEGAVVDITTTIDGGRVIVHVADHGRGLDEISRAALLVGPIPGGRSSDGGAGLGLAIVRQLTAALAGELLVDETPGGGLTVSVALPLVRTEDVLV